MYNRVATGVAATPAAALLPQLHGAASTVAIVAGAMILGILAITTIWANKRA